MPIAAVAKTLSVPHKQGRWIQTARRMVQLTRQDWLSVAVGLSSILRHPSVMPCRLASYQLGANLFSAPNVAVPTQQQHHGYQAALCPLATLL